MKLTIFFFGLLAIASTKAKKIESNDDSADLKGKREAPIGYYTSSGGPQTSHALQIQPSQGHGDSNAISIGAGYSIGGGGSGGKSFGNTYGAPAQSYKYASLQQGTTGHQQLDAPHFQLPNGQKFSSLEEVMQSLRASGLKVGSPSHSSAPVSVYGAPHGEASASLSSLGGHQFSLPQASYGATKLAPITLNLQQHSSQPSYAAGIQGLGAYASGPLGSTGPQLFNPAQSSSHGASVSVPAPSYAQSLSYDTPSSGHSFGDSSQSFGDSVLGHSLGGSGYSLGESGHSLGGSGISLGGSGHSFGGSGLSLGGSGHSLGGSGHSFGGLTSSKGLGALYGAPSTSSFKPSAFLGASVQGSHDDAFGSLEHGANAADALSSSIGGSFGGHSSLGGHGSFGGSSIGSGQSYLPPSEGFGSSGHSFGSSLGSFQLASAGHSSSPPGTSYGIPSGSYGLPSNTHGSSSNNHYQLSSKYTPQSYSSPSFGHASQSYSAPSSSHSSLSSSPSFGHGSHSYSSPSSSHSSLSSPSFGNGYSSSSSGLSYQSSPSSSYGTPRDSHGDHSETTYNTIKYSRNLTPKKM